MAVQFSRSVVSDSLRPHGLQHARPPCPPYHLPKFTIESVMPSNHLILCHPLLLPSSIFPSIGVFSNESALRIRWPKYWSFSFSISPANECSGLISFRTDWLDLLAVQGTLYVSKAYNWAVHSLCISNVTACLAQSVVSNSARPYGLRNLRLLCPWDSPGKNTGVGCHALLQGIFPTQGSNRSYFCIGRSVLYH